MGNCVSERKRYVTQFQKHDKIQLQYQFQKLILQNPSSRKNDRLYLPNFHQLFPENHKFAEQFHWFLEAFQNDPESGITYDTFLQISELLLLDKSENPLLSTFNRIQLVMMIVLFYATLNLETAMNSLSDLELSYFQTYNIVQIFLRIFNKKRYFDERPVKAFVDTLGKVTFMECYRLLHQLMPTLDELVGKYFGYKLLNTDEPTLPTLQHPSYILNNEWLSLLNLTFLSQDCSKLTLLYSTNVHERDFNLLSNLLVNINSPTIFLLQCEDNYLLGGYTYCEWKDDAQPNGSKDDCLFQMNPQFKVFRTKNDKFVRPQFTYMNSKNEDLIQGIGFGGELSKDFRIFIDSNLKQVHCNQNDKTFEQGNLIPKHLQDSQIQVLEVWVVQQARGTTHMKELIQNQFEENLEFEEFSQPQIHLDEDISSYCSGDHNSFEQFKEDSAKWDDESHHGFEEEIIIKHDGYEEIQRDKPEFETIPLNESCGRVEQSTKFQEVQIETDGSMQASTFEQAYAVVSGKFGEQSNNNDVNGSVNWNGESSDWNGNNSVSKSVKKVQLSKDLATITEELKESTNTQG